MAEIYIEHMLSSRGLSNANHQPLLESWMKNHQTTYALGASKGLDKIKHSLPLESQSLKTTKHTKPPFAKFCRSQNP
jgi:hypothetical protein